MTWADEEDGRWEDECERRDGLEDRERWNKQRRAGIVDSNDYQMLALATAIYPGRGNMIGRAYAALKLNGEAGEVAEEIGKSMRDDGGEISPERRAKILKELGDAQWYIAALASELGFTLSEVMKANIAKLQDRKARGVLSGSGSDR